MSHTGLRAHILKNDGGIVKYRIQQQLKKTNYVNIKEGVGRGNIIYLLICECMATY